MISSGCNSASIGATKHERKLKTIPSKNFEGSINYLNFRKLPSHNTFFYSVRQNKRMKARKQVMNCGKSSEKTYTFYNDNYKHQSAHTNKKYYTKIVDHKVNNPVTEVNSKITNNYIAVAKNKLQIHKNNDKIDTNNKEIHNIKINERIKKSEKSETNTVCEFDDLMEPKPEHIYKFDYPDNNDIKLNDKIVDTLYRISQEELKLNSVKSLVIKTTLNVDYYNTLIDSGSDTCLISESVVIKENILIKEKKNFVLKGIGCQNDKSNIQDSSIVPIGVSEISLKIGGNSLGKQEFFVLPDRYLPKDINIFMGYNFILKNNIKIHFKERCISYTGIDSKVNWVQCVIDQYSPLYDSLNSLQTVYYNMDCLLNEELIIEAKESKLYKIPVKINFPDCPDNDQMYIIDPIVNDKLPIVVLPGIVKKVVDEDIIVYAQLLINNDRKITLKKDTKIGTVCSLMEDDSYPPLIDNQNNSKFEWTKDEIKNVFPLDHLNVDLKGKYWDILYKHRKVFSKGNHDIGCFKDYEYKIGILDPAPLYLKPRHFNKELSDKIEEEVIRLSDLGYIEPSTAQYCSPIVPIIKPKTNTLRLCVDYSKGVNQRISKDLVPIPSIQDIWQKLANSKVFSIFDLKQAYYQIGLHKSSRPITTFVTERSKYMFKRVPFGLSASVGAFNRCVSTILEPMKYEATIPFFDDIIIGGDVHDELLERMDKMLGILEKYNLKISPEKSVVGKEEVDYLGYRISSKGIARSPEHIRALEEYPEPTNVKEVQRYLGLIAFQSKFLPNVAEHTRLLTQAIQGLGSTKKKTRKNSQRNIQITLNNEQREAFIKIKELVKKEVLLAYPQSGNKASDLELWVDASYWTMGACVTQVQEQKQLDGSIEKVRKFIAFSSSPFNKAQLHYSIVEKELASLRHFTLVHKNLLLGRRFSIMTDHQPLVYLMSNKQYNPRILRTMENLASFDYVIKYVPGLKNSAADSLSRIVRYNDKEIPSGDNLEYPVNYFASEEVLGGGNSMFDSLFWLLQRDKHKLLSKYKDSKEIREVLVENLVLNRKKYFKDMNKNDLLKQNRELRNMKVNHIVPSWEILLEASRMFERNILVFFSDLVMLNFSYKQNILLDKIGFEHNYYLHCRSGMHCNPLVLKTNKNGKTSEEVLEEILNRPEMEISAYSYGNFCEQIKNTLGVENIDHNLINDKPITLQCRQHETRTGLCLAIEENKNIQGGHICILIDSGSTRSAISQDIFKELITKPNIRSKIKLLTYNGQVNGLGNFKVHVTTIIKCPLNIIYTNEQSPLCVSNEAEFLVLESLNDQYCNMIGMNILHYFNCVLNGSNNTLEFPYTGQILKLMKPKKDFLLTDNEEINVNSDNNIGYDKLPIDLMVTPAIDQMNTIHRMRINTDSVLSINKKELYRIQRGDCSFRNLLVFINQITDINKIDFKDFPANCYHFKSFMKGIYLIDGIIYYNGKVILPKQFLIGLILDLHNNLAHIGFDKLMQKINSEIFYPKLKEIVLDITSSCLNCQMMKDHPLKVKAPILKIKTEYPGDIVAVDLLALPRTARGNIGCLVAIDLNSKRAIAVPIRSKTGNHISQLLETRILNAFVGPIKQLLSDNGGEFVSKDFQAVLFKYNIKHIKITPLNPTSTGSVERMNRTLLNLLRGLESQPCNWDLELARCIHIYNDTYHKEIKLSPNDYILTKNHVKSSIVHIPKSIIETWRDGSPLFSPYKVNDLVLFKATFKGNLTTNKLQERYLGPFRIKLVNSNNVSYVIERLVNNKYETKKAHYRSLRQWKLPNKYLREHPRYLEIYGRTLNLMNDQVPVNNDVLDKDNIVPVMEQTEDDMDKGKTHVHDLPILDDLNNSQGYWLLENSVDQLNNEVTEIKVCSDGNFVYFNKIIGNQIKDNIVTKVSMLNEKIKCNSIGLNTHTSKYTNNLIGLIAGHKSSTPICSTQPGLSNVWCSLNVNNSSDDLSASGLGLVTVSSSHQCEIQPLHSVNYVTDRSTYDSFNNYMNALKINCNCTKPKVDTIDVATQCDLDLFSYGEPNGSLHSFNLPCSSLLASPLIRTPPPQYIAWSLGSVLEDEVINSSPEDQNQFHENETPQNAIVSTPESMPSVPILRTIFEPIPVEFETTQRRHCTRSRGPVNNLPWVLPKRI